jgi:hypothetical protein
VTDDEEDREAEEKKKIKEEHERQLREARIKESRKLLFGDFAGIR